MSWYKPANGSSGSSGVAPGTIAYFASDTPPGGWIKANGALLDRTTYADLFSAIGVRYGAGDGSTTFAIPDLRGEFIRGWDDGRGVDGGRDLGSFQAGTKHINFYTGGTFAFPTNLTADDVEESAYAGGGWKVVSGGSTSSVSYTDPEHYRSRPRNIALLPCIKY